MCASRRANPQQQSWTALQRVIADTLRRRVIHDEEPLRDDQDADYMADHIADDLMKLTPRIPEEHWGPAAQQE